MQKCLDTTLNNEAELQGLHPKIFAPSAPLWICPTMDMPHYGYAPLAK